MSDSSNRSRRRGSRLAVAIVATGILMIATSATVMAAGPNTSTSSGAGTTFPIGDGATRVHPNPNIVDLHKQPWDHIRVSADGKRLTVYFWNGVNACYGLGKVDVSRHNGQLTITLWTGIRPHAIGILCVDLAQLYKTVVYLHQPIVGSAVL